MFLSFGKHQKKTVERVASKEWHMEKDMSANVWLFKPYTFNNYDFLKATK